MQDTARYIAAASESFNSDASSSQKRAFMACAFCDSVFWTSSELLQICKTWVANYCELYYGWDTLAEPGLVVGRFDLIGSRVRKSVETTSSIFYLIQLDFLCPLPGFVRFGDPLMSFSFYCFYDCFNVIQGDSCAIWCKRIMMVFYWSWSVGFPSHLNFLFTRSSSSRVPTSEIITDQSFSSVCKLIISINCLLWPKLTVRQFPFITQLLMRHMLATWINESQAHI
jgi:hypothetical protein